MGVQVWKARGVWVWGVWGCGSGRMWERGGVGV